MSELRPEVLEDADTGIKLVPLTDEDADDMGTLIREPGVPEYTWVPTEPPADFPTTWVGRYVDGWRDRARAGFAIRDLTDDSFLGFMALVQLDLEAQEAEAGYIVKEAARGRGIGTAALRILTDWSFETLGLERIEMHIDPANDASIRLAERAGYIREGVLRSMAFKEGRRCDLAVYSVIKADRSVEGEVT